MDPHFHVGQKRKNLAISVLSSLHRFKTQSLWGLFRIIFRILPSINLLLSLDGH